MLLEFSEAGPGIGIPYERREHARGTNHGYVDLKRHPAGIDDIPELTAHPELFRFVRNANGRASVFRTAGCDTEVSAREGRGWKYRSFIHVLFEILHWNTSRKCYLTLFEEFRIWIAQQEPGPSEAGVLFRLGPTSFRDHSFDGYSLRVYVEGCGESQTEARLAWAKALLCLSTFLEEFSSRHQPQLESCLKRVS